MVLNTLTKSGGDDLRNRVLDRAGIERDREFRIDTNYSDTECLELLDAATEEIGCTEKELFDLFSAQFVAETREIFPQFYSGCKNSEEFLRKQVAIHALIGASLRDKGQRQAINDKFVIEDTAPGSLTVRYNSPNKLCGLYHSLAHAVAESYKDTLTVRTICCSKKSGTGTACEFLVSWLHSIENTQAEKEAVGAEGRGS